METATLPVLDRTDTGNGESVAHYVDKGKSTEAYVFGKSLPALCGRVFVPSRDPHKLPICPECKGIYDSLK